MKTGKTLTFRFLSGTTEICWIYAIAAFTMSAINGSAFSFSAAVTVLVFSAILTGISHGRGWRVIYVGTLHLVGLLCSLFWGTYLSYYSSLPVVDSSWLYAVFHQSRTPVQWMTFVLTNVWIVLFWVSGRALALRKGEYHTVCTRFDIGLAAFFCLFLAKLVLLHKAGVNVQDPYSFSLIFPFFIFSLLLIGMSRIEHHAPKSFLPGYRAIGIIATFIMVLILYSGAVFLFCLPFLRAAADTGYHALKGGAGFVLPIIETILRFVFMGKKMREEPEQQSHSQDDTVYSSSPQGPLSEFFETLMKWGIGGIAGILILAGCFLIVYFLIKWLLSRTAHITGEKKEYSPVWIIHMWSLFVAYIRSLLVRMRGYSKASEFYSVLGEWGKHSGCTRSVSETPYEFCKKLGFCFPRLSVHFNLMVSMFHKEFYGEQTLSVGDMREIRTAWKSLRSPRHWPARAKSRLLQKEYRNHTGSAVS